MAEAIEETELALQHAQREITTQFPVKERYPRLLAMGCRVADRI